jgi:hypothetical protein
LFGAASALFVTRREFDLLRQHLDERHRELVELVRGRLPREGAGDDST